MNWVKFILLLLVFALLDAGNLINVIATPGALHIRPDLLLIMLVFFAGSSGATEAILISFIIGLAADISGEAGIMGPFTISFGIFGSIISQLRRVIIMKKMVYQCLAILIFGLAAGGLAQLLICLKTGQYASNLPVVVAGTAAYSAVIGPLIWIPLTALSRFVTRQYSSRQRSRR